MDIYSWLMERILDGTITDRESLQRYKIKASKRFKQGNIIPNSKILKIARERINDEKELEIIRQMVKRKVTRTISGVAPVAVMTSPAKCPHGKCICCPGGVETNTPQSYTGHEPAALRAGMNDYDPYLQTVNRIAQLEAIGHSTEKVDLIVMGGTFPARDTEYQENFIKRCFDGMNKAGTAAEENFRNIESDSLPEAHRENESAPHRCTGLTIETRPDFCMEAHVDRMLEQGTTRVELGVQSLHDEALLAIERGHGVKASAKATKILKDRGMKVCYHLMPGLPGETPESDFQMFRCVFTDPRFRPDMLKIYPVVVVAGTGLYERWKNGEYEPYDLDNITELIARVKEIVPPYVRIQRIQRDIPAKMIEGGVKFSNLRQIVRKRMKEIGTSCSCIRCREAGHNKTYKEEIDIEGVEVGETRYEASGGEEIFLEAVEKGSTILYGYLRLRFIPSDGNAARAEMEGRRTGIIRELKVVGQAMGIGKRDTSQLQHLGIGEQLLNRSEQIAMEAGMEQILVTSGVGVREYYRKRGYRRIGPYMGKTIR